MGVCVIEFCWNTQESTVKLVQEPMCSALNTLINLVVCVFLPCAFSVVLTKSSSFISIPERGRFQLIPGITSLLSLQPDATPTFIGISFLALPVIAL